MTTTLRTNRVRLNFALFSPIPSSIITMLLFGAVGLLLLSRRGARKPLPADLVGTKV